MKSTSTWIFAVLALLLSACTNADSRERTAPKPFTDFDELIFEQTACLFDCAAFELAVFADGRVLHTGPTFDNTGGPHESRIDARGLARIAQAVREARLDEMRGSYQETADGCEHWFTDMSTQSVRVNRRQGARSDYVILYAGCLGPTVPTRRINALFSAVDQVTGTGALIEQRKRARRPNAEAVEPAK
ncbi:DUF6438 domain-containing protein [Massilia sp. Mn16-1_5]|uniref:DUF6438 domain-containing protein n=1 Tax=Massilia sp. Mn16-1_5 TaxID=2079199 RepID=UPI00109E6A4F|nr:DUF6438 domain-containing protein [Massilia sp. Mn16-1_5]THC45461.1 hypothetical protein C2862_06730 [Massilia sp. Mn16-1_5]